ncbi:hypothetical protein GE09DRAFT_1123420 [Coniochaeta sp. 2T2.1]|nr:hypothetical protein GE09DRAFT_1123420 [Coniochaeta sp. 2T2.1]
MEYFIDVDDAGRLHVAAAVLPNLRIFGFAERFNWDIVLDIFRKHMPGRKHCYGSRATPAKARPCCCAASSMS